jgi:NADPH2:quinone reductase
VRALLCDAFAPIAALRVGDAAEPEAGPGQVLIEVACAGASFADGLVVQGKHAARPPFPFVPGIEAAGRVAAVGAGVGHVRPGDRVMAFARRGAFAERLAADAADVFSLPDGVSYALGAATLVNYGTAYQGLVDRGRLAEGETLLVLAAAGSIGLAAVELGRLLGARVIAAASTDAKRALALRNGADVAIDYTQGDFRETLRGVAPDGVDLVFDPVGGAAAEVVGRALRRGGRHLLIGFASGRFPHLPVNLYLLKQADILGILWGGNHPVEARRHSIARITQWLADGSLRPAIGGRWPLERGAEALLAVANRQVAGKALIEIADL